MSLQASRQNNFDLLRLLAAAQVAFFHVSSHLHIPLDHDHPAALFASIFPGVPIFFVISGFLISQAYERSPGIRHYLRNRFLRIYPALWVCLAFSIACASWQGGVDMFRTDALPWFLAQLTFVQFYNPAFLRGYGGGVLNGSLWTIPVELQFYLSVPILYWFIRGAKVHTNLILSLIAVASLTLRYSFFSQDDTNLILKLFGVSIFPYLWVFVLGILIQRNWDKLAPWLAGKGGWWILGYCGVAAVMHQLGYAVTVNLLHPVQMVVLGATAVSCALSAPGLSVRLLRGHDISYGLYLYHTVVVNVLIHAGIVGSWFAGVLAWLCAVGLGAASWFLVESPALRYKRAAKTPRREPQAA